MMFSSPVESHIWSLEKGRRGLRRSPEHIRSWGTGSEVELRWPLTLVLNWRLWSARENTRLEKHLDQSSGNRGIPQPWIYYRGLPCVIMATTETTHTSASPRYVFSGRIFTSALTGPVLIIYLAAQVPGPVPTLGGSLHLR